jgi:periplasmic copper chaperone A
MMKFKALLIGSLALFLLVMPILAQDDAGQCRLVYLFSAWARATPEGAPTGAVFGQLVNLNAEMDTLVSASTDAAEAVEIHEMVMGDGDVMQMRPVEGGLTVEPNNYVELAPGGLHVMLINLTQPLEAGESFDLVLNFEHAGEVSVTVPIVDMMAEGDTMMQPAMPSSPMEWEEACVGVHVVGAWARPAGPGMPNSAAYGLLLNLTDTDDVLLSANTVVSEATELHEMVMGDGDVMQMRPIEGGIAIPAGGTALLRPGGMHVMMIGLTEVLDDGGTLDLTLTFQENDPIELPVPIREPMEAGMMGRMS